MARSRPVPGDDTASLWRNREIFGLLAADLVSAAGDQLAKLAIAVLVFQRTHNALLTTLSYAVTYLPLVLAGPLLGSVVDRRPRRALMLACDGVRAVLAAAMVAVSGRLVVVWVLLALLTAVQSPFTAARSAILPEISGMDRYPTALSLLISSSQITQVLGFGVGGVVIASVGARGGLVIDALSFVGSALLLALFVRPRPPLPQPPRAPGLRGWWVDVGAGARLVAGHASLRRVVWVTGVTFGCVIATEGLGVPYAAALHRGTVAAGVLTAAVPAGNVVGLWLFSRVPAQHRLRTFHRASLVWPLPLVATVVHPDVGVAAALWFATGVLYSFQVLGNVLFAQWVPSAVRGRAVAFVFGLFWLLQGAGLLLSGGLVQLGVPVQRVVALIGVGGWAFCAVAAVRSAQSGGLGRHRGQGGSSLPADSRDSDVATPTGAVHAGPAGVPAGHLSAPLADREPVVSPGRGGRRQHAAETADGAPTSAATGTIQPGVRAQQLLLSLISLAVIAGCVVLDLSLPPRWVGSVRVPAWLLAVALAALSQTPVYLRRDSNVYIFMVTQLPMMLGLAFSGPKALLVAAVVQTLVAQVRVSRPEAFVKRAVNLATPLMEVTLAAAVWAWLGTSAPSFTPRLWAAAAAAILVSEIGSVLGLLGARALAGVRLDWVQERRGWVQALTGSAAAVSLALLAVTALQNNAQAGLLLVVVGSMAVYGLKAFARLQEQHLDLGRLYEFHERLQPLRISADALWPVLEDTRALLAAVQVSLELPGDSGDDVLTWVVSEDGQRTESVQHQHVLDLADASRAPGEILTVRLGIGTRQFGVLRAEGRRGRLRRFAGSDLRLLETLAAHVSEALDKGTLLEQLRQAATHDALTGTLNLAEFVRSVDERLLAGESGLVVLVEVAHLQEVNDSLGHDAGDGLLRTVALQLARALAEAEGLICRTGGGEFACFVGRTEETGAAEPMVAALAARVRGLVQVLGVTVELRTVVGWTASSPHARNASTLVRQAELALSAAKRGVDQLVAYRPEFEVDGLRRLRLINDLRAALDSNALEVVYQPIVRPTTGGVVGAEALVRWTHPELGPLPPDEFVALAEHSGLITALTHYVLHRALTTLGEWRRQGREMGISVNLSARCLADLDLPNRVFDALAQHRIEPEHLTLEITETSIAEDPERGLTVLQRLRSVGVRLSIDDFGTGYSSLAYLKRFPVQEVKMDRLFMSDIEAETPDDSLVSAVVAMGHRLKLEIVAEGLESEDAYRRLRAIGVDLVQGFYLGRPMSIEQWEAWWAGAAARGLVTSAP